MVGTADMSPAYGTPTTKNLIEKTGLRCEKATLLWSAPEEALTFLKLVTRPKRALEGPVTTKALGPLWSETKSWEVAERCLLVFTMWDSSSDKVKPVTDNIGLGTPSPPSRES